jgi:hypothetical protein
LPISIVRGENEEQQHKGEKVMKNGTREIEQKGSFRIIEQLDKYFDTDNLKGDVFNPDCIAEMHDTEMTVEKLKAEEIAFENEVEQLGVYGYVLEKWNPEVGAGWEVVDSCWGFIGQYEEKADSKFNHYIVAELRSKMTEGGNV